MPELDWVGKQYVLGLARAIPVRSLRRIPEISLHPGSENLIVHGDNLLALKALLPRYRERVKLVFIDPPYNADEERWFYGDPVYVTGIQDWSGEVGAKGEDPLRHDKWLCMMYPRLTLLRELLKTDGTIFISIGDNEIHHLRMLMDEVFGARNFLGCAVWHKGSSSSGDEGFFTSTHNYIVVYARDKTRASITEDLSTWWTRESFGDSREARLELKNLFPEARELFAIPKPSRLIQRIVESATGTESQDIVLDCFAGSGSTAHAVLKQNSIDGGDRRFILTEMEDFAEDLTAERVRRVIREQSGAGFDYFELDPSPQSGPG